MSKFLFGLIVGLIAVPVCVYCYFSSGRAPVATTAPPMPFEETLAHMALHARMDKELPKSVPIATPLTRCWNPGTHVARGPRIPPAADRGSLSPWERPLPHVVCGSRIPADSEAALDVRLERPG